MIGAPPRNQDSFEFRKWLEALVRYVNGLSIRTVVSDPQHITAASRPVGSLKEIVYYSGKLYVCVDATTPLWEKLTSA